MRSTKLILVEGIPGSGKSTTAQYLSRRLADDGIAVQWWYEEMSGHPLYIFDDLPSLQSVVEDFRCGRFADLIDRALVRWSDYADHVSSLDGTVILDSTFLGYLTWTLYAFDAPSRLIDDYVARVVDIIRPLEPALVYLRRDDVRATLANVSAIRGETWSSGTIAQATGSPRGKRYGLADFDGLVAYWKEYRDISDRIVQTTGIPTLVIDPTDQNWPRYYAELETFLGLTSRGGRPDAQADLGEFVGRYSYSDGHVEKTCEICLENGELVARDAPRLWRWNRLDRRAGDTFVAASFPIDIAFERNVAGDVIGARMRGEALLDGQVNWQLERLRA